MDDVVPDLITGNSILVTGGAGFIGSNIADLLSRDPSNTVTVIDDLSAGSFSNLGWIKGRNNCTFHKLDICDTPELNKFMDGIEIVLHQAAIASVQSSVEDPVGTNRANVQGTISCLQASVKSGIERFVFASSCAVYGDATEPPLGEDSPAKPVSPYGASKLSAEHYCRIFHELHGLHTVNLRYFNVYGPRQDPHSQYAAVIPRFITQMSSGTRPTIYGDGEQTRDFTYVVDIARANCMATINGKAAGHTYNVAGGEPVSINRLVRTLNQVMGTKLKAVHEAPRTGDILHSWSDLKLIEHDLGFKPLYQLERGLKKTISYFESKR